MSIRSGLVLPEDFTAVLVFRRAVYGQYGQAWCCRKTLRLDSIRSMWSGMVLPEDFTAVLVFRRAEYCQAEDFTAVLNTVNTVWHGVAGRPSCVPEG